jgi:hypothetical protein
MLDTHGCRFIESVVPIAALVAMVGSGCGPHRLYVGPPRPSDQIAVVEGVDSDRQSWRVVEVDGKKFSIFASQTFEIEPGRHQIAIAFKERVVSRVLESIEPCDVDFVAEAGHRYRVEVNAQRFTQLRGLWQAHLQDRDTRQKSPCIPRRPVEWS